LLDDSEHVRRSGIDLNLKTISKERTTTSVASAGLLQIVRKVRAHSGSTIVLSALTAVAMLTLPSGARAADNLNVLHTFTGKDGGFPSSQLIADSTGTLYGTTQQGGFLNVNCAFATCGVVFAMTRTPSGKWKESVLHAFTLGKDGATPIAGLVLDSTGNLYGTAYNGGRGNCSRRCGVAFVLTRTSSGKWKETVLHSFTGGEDGANPVSGLIFDTKGNLYGTTQTGGASGFGVVFELAPNSSGEWKERVLHAFTGGKDGGNPAASLVFDASGNLYGTTASGGRGKCQGRGCGVVFKLTPASGGNWKESVLHTFTGSDGAYPAATLILDPTGNLYGATPLGGAYNWGVAFKLKPDANGRWKERVLHTFTGGKDGAVPVALILDGSGNLYGTAYDGGIASCSFGCGVVFKLTPVANGRREETVLHSFTGGNDGANPEGSLIFGAKGNLYGTTTSGGTDSWGVVFELTR
jgi:uncharacterized repeat protein (TIGR03803 family)